MLTRRRAVRCGRLRCGRRPDDRKRQARRSAHPGNDRKEMPQPVFDATKIVRKRRKRRETDAATGLLLGRAGLR
jgi:hypothetical protein